jgi:hypothetical protein
VAVIALIKAWLMLRPIRVIKALRAAKRARQRAEADAAGGEFFDLDEGSRMNALKGAAKSKLVWLGLAQIAYSIFELWAQGTLSPQSAATAVSGGLTILFRAVTTQSLDEKGK